MTPSGFQTLKSIVPGFLNNAIAGGFCIPQQNVSFVGQIRICDQNACNAGAHGCGVSVHLDHLDMSVPDPQTFRLDAQFDGFAPVHVTYDTSVPFVPNLACTINVNLNDARVVADIGFGVHAGDDEDGGGAAAKGGELAITLKSIQSLDVSGLDLDASDCGVIIDAVASLVDFVADALSSQLGNLLVGLLTPVINNLIQGFLPDPLGIEGVVDLGSLLGGIAPGVEAKLETKAVPGGYVSLPAQGLSIGMIVGLNSDRDTETRDVGLASEGALCVPNRPAPAYTGVLPKVDGRGTFLLAPAGEFLGAPDPASDVAIGVSETVLDLAGHHVVNSGAMCLGVGTSLVPQLNLGTIGIVVPSLADLGGGTGKEPLLLVLRPQTPLDFTIGDGTEASPRLTIHINDMEVDFYAFLFDRYVRGFTVSLTLNLGLNLDFTTDDMGKPAIQPTLLGLDADSIGVEILNAEFLSESPAALEAVFPSLFDLIVPLLSESLGSIAIPDLEGFTLDELSFTKIVTNEDDFLGIYAGLAVSSAEKLALIEAGRPWLPAGYEPRQLKPFRKLETRAEVVRLTVPPPAEITAALVRDRHERKSGAGIPEIELALGHDAPHGTAVEWQWRLDGGLWHDWVEDPHPVLREKAFAIQGRHTLQVRARTVGDFRTFDDTPVEIPLVIDSAPPRLLAARTEVVGDQVRFVGTDLVTADADLRWAFVTSVDDVAGAEWRTSGVAAADELKALADDGGHLLVLLRDEKGNVGQHDVDLGLVLGFHGRAPAGGSGCDCEVGSGAGQSGTLAAGLLACFLLVPLALGRRRVLALARRAGAKAPWAAFVVILSTGPACDCSGDPPGTLDCEIDEDCAEFCGDDKIGICQDGMCFCADDVPYGKIGMHSDLAVSPANGQSWVSAYNQTHGDLMVAPVIDSGRIPDESWQFVDGVPDGPVALPESDVRGGIRAPGDDVGLYTSIAVAQDGTPMVTYFDASHSSLRFAAQYGGVWSTMTIDEGQPVVPEIGGEEAGRYSSISISAIDGKPGVAYLATVVEGASARTELRFAQAATATPSTPADWNVFVVDSAVVPPLPEGQEPIADLPEAVSLFVASARLPDGSPLLAYYDRLNGDLKIARFDLPNNLFLAPEVVDGADGSDVGLYPSLAVDPDGKVHLSYVDATRDNLLYMNLTDRTPVVIDDGYRIDGVTEDNLPKPVFHFIGDDSQIVSTGAALAVAYQDATTHELRLAVGDATTGTWVHGPVAGAEDPYVGGYGFYAAGDLSGGDIVMSSWVVDNFNYDYFVEVFRQAIVIQ